MLPVRMNKEHNLAIVPNVKNIATLVPHSRVVKRKGHEFALVPAGRDELQLLRNLGFDAPTPAEFNYDWAGNVPFKAQIGTFDMLIHNKRAYVLNEIGTGKSLSVLFAYDYLRSKKMARKMLVVAPLSTLTCVWAREVFARMPHLSTSVLHGSRTQRLKALALDADIYIINHDGVGVILDELGQKKGLDVICVDELAVFRNKSTTRWKNLDQLTRKRLYVWGLTGSPTPKEPTDAWAQVRLLTPNRVTPFRKQFREQTMVQISQFKWLPKQDANDIVLDVMQPSVRYTRDDCVDLPPTTYSSRSVALTNAQRKAYNDMLSKEYTEFLEGRVVAANAGVKTSKLLQICCGFAYDENHNPIDIDATPRINVLKEILEEASNKVIVFVPFIRGVDTLFSELSKTEEKIQRVYGDTPKKERDQIFNDFQHGSGHGVLIAHPQCMAHGLTLTAADTIVWYSPHPSLEIFEQANGRITRPGQQHNTHIIMLESTPIEQRVYNKLEKRANAQNALLDLFEAMKEANED